jgi:hypothetical protein
MMNQLLANMAASVSTLETQAPSGTPSPQPAKAPLDGSTPEQVQCTKIAHLAYRLELLEGVNPSTAWQNYCDAFDACYPE